MLPIFPNFKKIELSDRADVEAHTNLFEPYSDFNFTCLWAWDNGERMISELNGNLVVRFTEYHTHEPLLSFLGKNNCEETARTLIDYCKENNFPTTLRLMPDVSIFGIDPTKFIIEESRGDFDYILSVKQLVLLVGKQFHQKKKKVSNFWKENSTARLVPIDLSDHKIQVQIFGTISAWEGHKHLMKKDYEIEHELAATKRLFGSDCLNSCLATGLFLGDLMLGYAIGEGLDKDYVISHFSRCLGSYGGVSEALMQSYAKYLYLPHVIYMNIESDLGIDNMRQSKMSWRPIKFLKRYNVRYAQI